MNYLYYEQVDLKTLEEYMLKTMIQILLADQFAFERSSISESIWPEVLSQLPDEGRCKIQDQLSQEIYRFFC